MRALILTLFGIAVLIPEPAQSARWPSRKVQKLCFVDLTEMPEGKLKRRCFKLSKRLP